LGGRSPDIDWRLPRHRVFTRSALVDVAAGRDHEDRQEVIDVVTSITNPPSADPKPPLVGETNHRPDITGGRASMARDDPLAIGSTEP
jgi:hypothetical protein